MTIQIIESLIKLAGAAVIVALAILLLAIGSRFSLPVIIAGAVIFAVYANCRIARKGLLKFIN